MNKKNEEENNNNNKGEGRKNYKDFNFINQESSANVEELP